MKYLMYWLMPFASLFASGIAWADEIVDIVAVSAPAPMASIAVPEGSPWYATIIAAIFPILLGFLTWLSARVSSFVASKLQEAKTGEQGKWYSAAFGLAAIAVKAAETFYGPDSGRGKEKKALAAKWLTDRLVAMDANLLKKNPNAAELVSGLVDAAYADVFTAFSPLAPGVAASSSKPSAWGTTSLSGT